MKKYSVIYFTRTNNSKRVAEKISGKLTCELVQITDNINWKGLIGYIKAGFYSTMNKHVEIQFLGNFEAAEEYIVVGPLWAGGLAPALRTLLSQLPRNQVHLVATSIESLVEDRSGFLSVSHITRKSGNEDSVIEGLVDTLMES